MLKDQFVLLEERRMPEPAHNASGSVTKTKVRASLLLLMEWTAVDPHKPSVGRFARVLPFPPTSQIDV